MVSVSNRLVHFISAGWRTPSNSTRAVTPHRQSENWLLLVKLRTVFLDTMSKCFVHGSAHYMKVLKISAYSDQNGLKSQISVFHFGMHKKNINYQNQICLILMNNARTAKAFLPLECNWPPNLQKWCCHYTSILTNLRESWTKLHLLSFMHTLLACEIWSPPFGATARQLFVVRHVKTRIAPSSP